MIRMRRRECIALLGGLVAISPRAILAQSSPRTTRIGLLGATGPSDLEGRVERFRRGLRDFGYIEGKNLFIVSRWAEGNYARLEELAAELVRLNVDILVTYGTPGTLAAKQATKTMPIVMLISGDAVATGIVESLSRPGGNVTGSTFLEPELDTKLLELLKEADHSARRVGVLVNPDNPLIPPDLQAMERTAESLQFELQPLKARTADELDQLISSSAAAGLDAIAVSGDAVFLTNAARIAKIVADNRLPSIGFSELARAGGLIGYGPDLLALWYRGAYFVDKIVRGTTPANIPIELPTKFELVINLKTAAALGIEVPPTLVARADEVIE